MAGDTKKKALDYLDQHLERAGLDVIRETNDRLIHRFVRFRENGQRFEKALRVKAASTSSFNVYRRKDNLDNGLVVYVWWIQNPRQSNEIYAMTYNEAVSILEKKGYADTSSWSDKGWYHVSDAFHNTGLFELIEPYRMTPDKWRDKLLESAEFDTNRQQISDIVPDNFLIKDTQLVEILGRNRLVNELMAAGIETARPERDMGIDLIAYLATDESFKSKPLQIKAASQQSFSINRKYERFDELLLIFIWGLQDDSPDETYALTYPEAIAVGNVMGYTQTKSWQKGRYSVTSISAKLAGLLAPYRMTPDKWIERILE